MPTKVVRVNKKPGEVGPNGGAKHWEKSQKLDAVARWLILGNLVEVSRQMNIPEITLRKWKASDFWSEAEKELRLQANLELEGKLGRVIDKSIENTLDRLDKGDLVYNQKTGKFTRVPIKAQVINQISKTMLDKKFILEKINNKQEHSEEAVKDRLDALKKAFLDFAKNRKVVDESQVIDVMPTQITQGESHA